MIEKDTMNIMVDVGLFVLILILIIATFLKVMT